MVGETIQQQRDNGLLLPHGDGGDIHRGQQVAVKESVLPFKRFRTPLGKTVDVLLGPEMRSTGEVMGFDRDFPHAFAKSQLAAYEGGLPTSGNVFISVNDTDKRQLPLFAARLVELGFNIWPPKARHPCCAATASIPRSSTRSACVWTPIQTTRSPPTMRRAASARTSSS